MNKKIKLRSLLAGAVFTLFFVSIMARMYWIQVVDASMLMDEAKKTWETSKQLLPTRGAITDRNGQVLAQDAAAYTVAVNPDLIHKNGTADEVVEMLAPILGMTSAEKKQELYGKVTAKQSNGDYYIQVEIRREGWKIDSERANQIREEMKERDLNGIYLLEEKKRYYPLKQLASHVLGYTNLEGEAQQGIEQQYDDILRGIPGKISYERDRLGYEIPGGEVELIPPQNGDNIRLTIDEKIQLFVEQALEKAYKQFRPKSMTAIAADPETMEILAMANMPTYNPNEYWDFDSFEDFKNNSVSALYEPGSTFKIVTLAAAVEEGIFNPEDEFQSGSINVAGTPIHDHNYGQGWGRISYMEGLKRSSNVAFVKLGYEQLGAEKLRSYIDAFGFGTKTGIDIQGELAGSISFRNWIATEVATATFGQGLVQVTPLQQVAAISAIANGGELKQPYLVKEIVDSETGEVIESNEPKTIRRVISEETSKQVGDYLEQVISDQEIGTGRMAYIDGYRIAGKTGTAQKVVNGKYADGQYVVSFIGYAPVENPKIALIVIADAPDLDGDYRNGSQVVAPAFREIMSKSLRYLGVSEQEEEGTSISSPAGDSQVPDLKGLAVSAAENKLQVQGISYEIIGEGTEVIAQIPQQGSEIVSGERIYMLTEAPEKAEIPDLKGKSLRDALQIAKLLQLETVVEGEGYVDAQELQTAGGTRKLFLQLKPLREISSDSDDEDEG
ncbi:penicillin-binding transpeptidase domain-containing protein [Marinicrinis lubricantis]|uniref:Penicillin-binding transpeptidase domain-containing protein n=1 Tax=Marinicrinis lubricantis TaxID=2086470 RepID=A0ABW1ISG4_9BACL